MRRGNARALRPWQLTHITGPGAVAAATDFPQPPGPYSRTLIVVGAGGASTNDKTGTSVMPPSSSWWHWPEPLPGELRAAGHRRGVQPRDPPVGLAPIL